jgi:hypothetical protein
MFVMSAMMFTAKTRKVFSGTAGNVSAGVIKEDGEDSNADLSFESHIPHEFRPTAKEFRWMRENPWRGAEALHFLILVQRFIHGAQYGNAMKAALHLRYWTKLVYYFEV